MKVTYYFIEILINGSDQNCQFLTQNAKYNHSFIMASDWGDKWHFKGHFIWDTCTIISLVKIRHFSSEPSNIHTSSWHSYSIIWWTYLLLASEITGLYPIMWCFPGISGSRNIVHQYSVCLTKETRRTYTVQHYPRACLFIWTYAMTTKETSFRPRCGTKDKV